jgi:hypothetical protein
LEFPLQMTCARLPGSNPTRLSALPRDSWVEAQPVLGIATPSCYTHGTAFTPDFMSRDEFFRRIRSSSAEVLAREFFHSETAHIFSDEAAYSAFREKVSTSIPNVESVAVVGSGNWQYSLNPEKAFREFGAHSDVDVAVISCSQFHSLWEEMRQNHRRHFYALAYSHRERLRRNSENVYCGFISPDWIPKRPPR